MKKLLTTLVLATFLLVCTVPSVSAADHTRVADGTLVATLANAMVFPTDGTNTTAYCPVCCKSATWKPLTEETISGGYTIPKANAHYYLADSVSNSTVKITPPNSSSYTVCLHLNGKNLTNTADLVFEGKASKLNIMGSGEVKGGYTGATYGATIGIGNMGSVNLFGGTYSKNNPSSTANTIAITWGGTINIYSGATINSGTAGSAVYLKGSLGDSETRFNMYGGTVEGTGSSEAAVELAAAVLPNAKNSDVLFVPTFNMYGGTIQNGSGTNGGNMAVGAYSVLNMYGGTIQKGSAANGGNVYLAGGATFNMYGGNISNGTATDQGGSIYATNYISDTSTARSVINIYDGTISTSSAPKGGNISLYTNTELNMYGGTVENGTASSEGGNIYAKAAYGVATSEWVDVYLKNATISGGEATGNGGNMGLTRANLTIEEGTKLQNGTADGGRGGNFRIYHGKVMMNGGVISGGNATSKYANGGSDDIWLQGGDINSLSVMYMLGGKVESIDDRDGSALTVSEFGRLYLGGSASTVNTNSKKAEIYSNGKIYICDGWTGSATIIYKDDALAENAVVANTRTKVVTLDAQYNATDGGSYTGKLIHQPTQLEISTTPTGTLTVGGVSMVSADGTVTPTNDPLTAWDTGKYAYIRLSGTTYTIEDLGGRTICIDINGCDLTVNGQGTISAFDSANDTFDSQKCGSITGSATVEVDVAAPNGNRYIAVTDTENNRTTLHRLDMRVTSVVLRASAAGLYYKASYSCDDVLASKVTKYGMVLSVNNMPGADFAAETEDINLFTVGNEAFKNGLVTTSCSVFGILTEETVNENSQRSQMKIYVNPYINLDELVLVGDTENPGKTAEDPTYSGVSLSLRDTMDLMDSIYPDYAAEQQDTMNQFYTQWKDKGMDWKMENITGQLSIDNSDLTFTATNKAFCPVCRKTVTWTPITQKDYGTTKIGKASKGAHYYLAEDVIHYGGTESFLSAPNSTETACFHLNGHNLTTIGNETRPIMGAGGVLNIMGNGTVCGSFNSSTSVGATVNINTAVSAGTVNLYGGIYTKISVNGSENPVVSVYNNGGQIHLYEGAEIRGDGINYSAYLGAATKANAVFGVHGGKILGGKLSATEPGTAFTSTVIIDGNSYLEELVIRDKAITTHISGMPVIEKLALATDAKLTLGKLLPGADLAVSANGVFTKEIDHTWAYLPYIHAWNAPDSIAATGNTLRYDVNYEHYMTPYREDVSAKAVEEGKILYYFMSGENMVMSTINAGDVYKWGDCCLIAFPNGETMLVDSSYAVHAPVVIGNLKRMGVTELDYLVITHPHGDHIGGAFSSSSTFLNEISVGKVYYEDLPFPNNSWVGVVESKCEANNIPYENLEKGKVLTIGEGDLAVTIKVLWPKEELTDGELSADAAENNNSLVFRLDYGEHSSLFTADIYTATEKKLVDLYGSELDTDLMKIPHHGWSSSNSEAFVNAITPEIAVATGAHEMGIKYWKPYNKANALLLSDLHNGYIHVSADRSGNMEYETSH